MRTKKLVFTVLAMLVAFSLIAASVMPARFIIKKDEKVEFYQGRTGVSFTESQFSGVVRLTRPDDSSVGATNHPKFTHSLLDVRLTKTNGEKVTFVLGAVYVFFVVKPSEVRAWERGELGLYRFDSWDKTWKECGSFLVKNGNGRPRIACRMRVFGVYGLAEISD
jgi:hypothetical protein